MTKNTDSILEYVLANVKPSEKELREIKKKLAEYTEKIRKNLRRIKVNADIFVGGSAAKGTLIKKDVYDIDLFLRFDKKYKNEILSDLAEKAISGMRGMRVHGSRDYFRIKISEGIFLEIVPVRRIKNPAEAENVTDLSYSHVNYIKKKVKSQKLLDEIRLAKAFCYANNAYGAESYVRGFSGYAIELLVYHYKGFLKFVKEIAKMKYHGNNKSVIDIEKRHKNKGSILIDLNEAKLKSPIILVDPTYKQRNVLAALSEETLGNFQNTCKKFLKKPSAAFFLQKKIDLEKIKKNSYSKGYDFLELKMTTNKQEGDIAGSKLLKFYRHLSEEAGKFFDIKEKGFEYNREKSAKIFFAGKKRQWIVTNGPTVDDKSNSERFRAAHRSVFIKNSRLYSKEGINLTLKEFIRKFKDKNQKKIGDMSITRIEILD
ncbi:MAG: nucleotidyltransferase domain-containing protein [Nanoarchaeota archaeon]